MPQIKITYEDQNHLFQESDEDDTLPSVEPKIHSSGKYRWGIEWHRIAGSILSKKRRRPQYSVSLNRTAPNNQIVVKPPPPWGFKILSESEAGRTMTFSEKNNQYVDVKNEDIVDLAWNIMIYGW